MIWAIGGVLLAAAYFMIWALCVMASRSERYDETH